MDIAKRIKASDEICRSIDKVNNPESKRVHVALASIFLDIHQKFIMEKSFQAAFDGFAEYIERKQYYLQKLETEMGQDFETDGKPWAKAKQYQRTHDDVQMLYLIATYLVDMEAILRGDMASEKESMSEVMDEAEHYKKQAQYWHQEYLKLMDSEIFYTGLALKMAEKGQYINEKLSRYQTLFIQKNIQL